MSHRKIKSKASAKREGVKSLRTSRRHGTYPRKDRKTAPDPEEALRLELAFIAEDDRRNAADDAASNSDAL